MSKWDDYYLGIVPIDGEDYLVQDAEFLDSPMYRCVDDLFECEREEVQRLMLEREGEN